MKRREAIRNIVIASAGTMFITGCSDKNVIEFLKEGKLLLNNKHINYLSAISEAFLPRETDPGAIDTPEGFILNMLNECYSYEDIEKYARGFEQYKMLMAENKMKITTSDANKIIKAVEETLAAKEPQEELVFFINTTKRRTTQHFLSSQTYMTEVENYMLVPERFDGCIDV